MKKLTILLFMATASIATAQTTKIKSKALGDSIVMQKAAYEIAPIVVDALGDTARSINWYTTSISRDTTAGFNVVINIFDRSGNSLGTVSNSIPGNVWNKWALFITKMDTFVLTQRKRFIKQ